jgi:hypothetical protein
MFKLLTSPAIGAWLVSMSILAAPAGAAPQ